MTSSRRRRSGASDPPGRSPKGGFPWWNRSSAGPRRRASRGARSRWRSLIIALLAGGRRRLHRHRSRGFRPRSGSRATASIAYDAGGDIYTADPSDRRGDRDRVRSRDRWLGPRFSPDGTHIVFERKARHGGWAALRRALGRQRPHADHARAAQAHAALHGEPWEPYEFSPDGRSVLIAASEGRKPTISIAQSDGSGVRRSTSACPPTNRRFDRRTAPRSCSSATTAGQMRPGSYAVDVSTGTSGRSSNPRPTSIWPERRGRRTDPGSRTGDGATEERRSAREPTSSRRTGIGTSSFRRPPDAVWKSVADWSNDGTRLFIMRGYTPAYEDVRPRRDPGGRQRSSGMEIRYPGVVNGECCAELGMGAGRFQILVTPIDARGTRASR